MEPSRPLESRSRQRCLTFAALSGGCGLVLGSLIFSDAAGAGWGAMALSAGAGAALTQGMLWWWFMERPRRYRIRRGTLVGALSGLLAHYPCWYFVILVQNVSYWILDGSGSSPWARRRSTP